MWRTTSTRGNTARGATSSPGAAGGTSRSTRYCLSSSSFTLNLGWCFLIRWFSSSPASFSPWTTILPTPTPPRDHLVDQQHQAAAVERGQREQVEHADVHAQHHQQLEPVDPAGLPRLLELDRDPDRAAGIELFLAGDHVLEPRQDRLGLID